MNRSIGRGHAGSTDSQVRISDTAADRTDQILCRYGQPRIPSRRFWARGA